MRPLHGHSWAVRAVAFHPKEPTTLASYGDDRILRVWDTASGECVHQAKGIRSPGMGLCFSRDGRFLVSGDRNGSLIAWNSEENWEPHYAHHSRRLIGPINELAMLPSNIVLGSYGYVMRSDSRGLFTEWPLSESEPPSEYPWPVAITSLSASLDGDRVAIAGENRTVTIWQRSSFGEQPTLAFPNTVLSVRYSPVDPHLLAVAWGGNVELFRDTAPEERIVCRGHRSFVQTLTFSHDGRVLLSGAADKSVRLWDAFTGNELAAFDWGVGKVLCVAVACDGMTAVAGGTKSDLMLWDLS